jgi:hypothetical protein
VTILRLLPKMGTILPKEASSNMLCIDMHIFPVTDTCIIIYINGYAHEIQQNIRIGAWNQERDGLRYPWR